MNTLANKMKVMQLLGTGLSVKSLLQKTELTMNELCELAEQYPDLERELKRWYKRYDFSVKQEVVQEETPKETQKTDNSLETKEKPVKRKKAK